MSILIKGMDMPTRCADCPMCYDFISCQLEGKAFGEIDCIEIRADWCPLIELPPHGRLIDADMLTTVTEMVNGEFKTYIEVFEVDDAPTIIEASPYRYEMLSKTDKPHGIYFIESEGADA